MGPTSNSFRLAQVTRIRPGGHAVDLVFVDDGYRVAGVQVISSAASSNTGLNDLPETETGRELIAVVIFMAGMPLVIGFLFPQISEMLFSDPGRKITRHSSDVYSSIDRDGNAEWYHPSGTYIRIGTTPAHEDLTGKDFDQKWRTRRNTDKAVHFHLEIQNGGVSKGVIDIDPNGNGTLTLKGDLSVDVSGNLNATIGGNATVNVTGAVAGYAASWSFTGPATFNQAVTVKGLLAGQAGLAISGGSGASITGSLSATGDVTAGSISLQGHTHSDPQGGTVGPAQ